MSNNNCTACGHPVMPSGPVNRTEYILIPSLCRGIAIDKEAAEYLYVDEGDYYPGEQLRAHGRSCIILGLFIGALIASLWIAVMTEGFLG